MPEQATYSSCVRVQPQSSLSVSGINPALAGCISRGATPAATNCLFQNQSQVLMTTYFTVKTELKSVHFAFAHEPSLSTFSNFRSLV